MRYFLHIAYEGYYYHGWQRQPKVRSVQETLETILSKILKETIICYGCGRTDAQVHASQYVLHINVERELDTNFLYILNKNLPIDIACFEVLKVEDNQHARYDAIERTYKYYLHFDKDPFLSRISTLISEHKLCVEEMSKAVALLPQYEDFRAFCFTPDKHNHTLCTVFDAKLLLSEQDNRLQFSITANRFLKTMIRIIVGALVNIGKGEMSVDEFESRLRTGMHPNYRAIAPPQGLHLAKVVYPYLTFPQKSFLHSQTTDWKSLK